MLYTICIALILIASVLIILAVLVQNPKSGMAANFGASNQVMGVRETSDFLEKFTWTMAIAIVVLSLVATLAMDKGLVAESNSEISKDVKALQERVIESETPAMMPQGLGFSRTVPAARNGVPGRCGCCLIFYKPWIFHGFSFFPYSVVRPAPKYCRVQDNRSNPKSVIMTTESGIKYFENREEWRRWLTDNFDTAREIWFVFPHKSSGKKSIVYNDAVEEAPLFRLDRQHDKTPRRRA